MVRVNDATTVLHWTASEGSARSASLAMLRLCSVRRLRTVWPIFFVVLTILLAWRIDPYYSAATRWKYGALFAAGYTVAAFLVSTLVTYVQLRRSLGPRLRPGTELVAGWDADSVRLSRPAAEIRIPTGSISRVRRLGGWTAFQQTDVKAWSIWPSPLFPDEFVVRLRT